jgi:hypothetical protein
MTMQMFISCATLCLSIGIGMFAVRCVRHLGEQGDWFSFCCKILVGLFSFLIAQKVFRIVAWYFDFQLVELIYNQETGEIYGQLMADLTFRDVALLVGDCVGCYAAHYLLYAIRYPMFHKTVMNENGEEQVISKRAMPVPAMPPPPLKPPPVLKSVTNRQYGRSVSISPPKSHKPDDPT